jgi:hypothetical protein
MDHAFLADNYFPYNPRKLFEVRVYSLQEKISRRGFVAK